MDYEKDPMVAYSAAQKAASTAASLPGMIDPQLVGIWKWALPGDINTIYDFASDGTFHYYVGSTVATGQEMYAEGTNYWRLNGNVLEVYYSEMNVKATNDLQKMTDPLTGKPSLRIQFRGTEYRTYLKME